jgi:hypothetical protein
MTPPSTAPTTAPGGPATTSPDAAPMPTPVMVVSRAPALVQWHITAPAINATLRTRFMRVPRQSFDATDLPAFH